MTFGYIFPVLLWNLHIFTSVVLKFFMLQLCVSTILVMIIFTVFHCSSSVTGGVEISLLNSLFLLSSLENLNSELVRNYYREAEDVLKILKPILNAIVHTQIASDRLLQNVFSELGRAIDELMELFETCQPWSSKIYFVRLWIFAFHL